MKPWQTVRQLMERVLFTRPRRPVRHGRGRLGIEILEDRLCPSSYIITDLGQNPSTQAGINDSGQVARTLHLFDRRYYDGDNFAYRYPEPLIFDSLGGQFAHAYGINNLGDVVGDAETI